MPYNHHRITLTAQTDQAAFDTAIIHLLGMERRSMRRAPHVDQCAYRGPRGARCAVGVMIPDDQYDPAIEGNGVHALNLVLGDIDVELLADLQDLHDNDSNWSTVGFRTDKATWGLVLRLAEQFGLDTAKVTAAKK